MANKNLLLRLCIVPVAAAALVGCAPMTFGSDIPEARCRAAGAEAFLGRFADERAIDGARAAAGAMRERVIRPGQSYTMDVDPQRLNIELDATDHIRRLRCG
jgi:hypothetical protein